MSAKQVQPKQVQIISPRDTQEALELRRRIGDRLRARREYLDVSRAELGEIVGVSEKGFGHYETGHAELVPTKLDKLARRLGVSVNYFFSDDQADELDQDDRDVIRFLHGMPPGISATARAVVKTMHDTNARDETTHGKKAE